jgi:uncharacterized membrane protein YidH (DUF202 family)
MCKEYDKNKKKIETQAQLKPLNQYIIVVYVLCIVVKVITAIIIQNITH